MFGAPDTITADNEKPIEEMVDRLLACDERLKMTESRLGRQRHKQTK